MKKSMLAALLTSTLLLTGCNEEKDQAYYLKNLDKAQSKKAECEKVFKQAFEKNDKDAFEKLRKDLECQAADKAIKEDRQIKAEQERQAKEAVDRAEIDKLKVDWQKQLEGKNWQETAHLFVNSECAQYGNLFGGFHVPKDNFSCRALVEIYEENVEKGKIELLKSSFEELAEQEKNFCNQDKRRYSACFIWEEALGVQATEHFAQMDIQSLEKLQDKYQQYNTKRPQKEAEAFRKIFETKGQEVIENYVKNPEQLKIDYNQCVDKLNAIGDQIKQYKAWSKVAESYPCTYASKARSKLGFSWDNFKTKLD